MSKFIHFRVQSSYSFLESTLTIDKIVALTKANNMSVVCLADRGNLFGSLEFSSYCVKNKIQPIHGALLNVLFEYPSTKTDKSKNIFAEIMCIAKDDIGYKNLLKLVYYHFNKPNNVSHISLNELTNHSEGIISLSCYIDGIIGKNLLAKKPDEAIYWTKYLSNIFQDRFYFEIMRHNISEEKLIENDYINIAIDHDIPLIATNKILFAKPIDHDAHDVLLCIEAGLPKDIDDRHKAPTGCYFKSEYEMIELFADLPAAIENSLHLAHRCYVMSEENKPMLPSFASHDITENELIKNESYQGLSNRLATKFRLENINVIDQENIKKQYFERLDYELSIICKMDFSGYFLIVSDFIKWSKENNILVGPGRGSGAGSIVAWCLLITDLDPIKFGLLFERFLNPERISMPDFDIDFCQERREEVIKYVRSKYGDTRVGQIITFGKMQAKAVIKDVSRVLGLPYKYADYLTELVPFNAVAPVTLSQAIKEVKELNTASKGQGLYNLDGNHELIKQVLDTSLKLEGLHRHSSTHAAGVVIAKTDLVEIVPVHHDHNNNMLVVQYSMKYAEMAGLIKFDFLGLQTLTVITKCKELLKKRNIDIDFNDMTFDDDITYKMLCDGSGTGVFQFESVGMKDSLKRLKPDSINDLIALGALYRPGPMDNIPTYIACKHGLQEPNYLHPIIRPVLEETYGVIIYQEQVLEIAKRLSNYTLGAADLLRRAMGKKIKAEMEQQEAIFVQGAIANNVPKDQAKSIFEIVAKFASYGFNKSHASAYGVISYQTAYLKANFPVEFLIACLNLELNNHDKINIFLQEVRNNNITIIPPCINRSFGNFAIDYNENDTILYGLGAIKSVTLNFAKILEDERSKRGSFKDIINFIERMPIKSFNKKLLENLIKAGAFDKLHDNRNQLLLSIAKLLSYAASYNNETISNQMSLIKVHDISNDVIEKAPYLNNLSLGKYEFEVLGLFIIKHPLLEYTKLLENFIEYNSSNLNKKLKLGASTIKIAGVIQKKDSRMSARGRFITLQLSDQYNIFEVTIFSEEILKNYVHLIDVGNVIVAVCDAYKDEGGFRLTAKSFESVESLTQGVCVNITIRLHNYDEVENIINLLKNSIDENNPNVDISIILEFEKNDYDCNKFIGKIQMPKIFSLNSDIIDFYHSFTN